MTTPTIGIACHSFRTDGGMGRYVQLLAEGLLNLGIHPTVITKKIDYSLPLSKEVSFHHINCKFIPSKLRDYYYGKLFKNPRCQAGWNKNVLFGFS